MIDPALVVAVLGLSGSVVAGFFALRGKTTEVRSSDDANLRDDQRELLVELRAALNDSRRDTQAERSERGRLEVEIERLRTDMAQLRETLAATRRELHETQRELKEEREARRAGEDAGKQRQMQSETRIAKLNGDYVDGVEGDEPPESTP